MTTPRHVAIMVSFAPSLINFRGPLIREMLARGWRVDLLAPDIDAATRDTLTGWGAACHDIPLSRRGLNPLSDLRSMRRLSGILARLRPEMLITYTIKPNIWGTFAASRAGVKSVAVITGLGLAFTPSRSASARQALVGWIARRLFRLSTRRNAHVIFQNPNDRDDFIAAGCLEDVAKMGLIAGSGVDLKHYKPAPLPAEPTFLMISRLLGNKGVREYAQAAQLVRLAYPQGRFLLAGPFDEGADCIAMAELEAWQRAGLEYLGPLQDVRPALGRARIYVLPSYREGTPRSVLEAMATGRPILTCDVPGCRETVQEGRNGHLVPAQDSVALAARMRDMIDNPDRTEEMGRESLRMVRERFDVAVVNGSLLEQIGL